MLNFKKRQYFCITKPIMHNASKYVRFMQLWPLLTGILFQNAPSYSDSYISNNCGGGGEAFANHVLEVLLWQIAWNSMLCIKTISSWAIIQWGIITKKLDLWLDWMAMLWIFESVPNSAFNHLKLTGLSGYYHSRYCRTWHTFIPLNIV